MRGCGGEDGEVVMRVIRAMGGRAQPSQARARAYVAMGQKANKWRGFDVALGLLVESGALKVCRDGCYEIPKVKRCEVEAVHRGMTFYSTPELGTEEVLRESPWKDVREGRPRMGGARGDD